MKLGNNRLNIILFSIFLGIYTGGNAQRLKAGSFDPNKEYTQSYIDSLITGSNRIRQSVSEFKKILDANNNLFGWPHYYYGKSSFAFQDEKYDSILVYTDRGIDSYRNAKIQRPIDEESLIPLYLIRGRAFIELKEYKNSISSYQAALDLTQKYYYKWKSYLTTGIAACHENLGNDSIALNYYLKASTDTLFMNIPRSAVATHMSIGAIYKRLNKPRNSEEGYLKALKFSKETDFKTEIHEIYYQLGELKYRKSKMDSVNYYFEKGNEAFDKYGYGPAPNGSINYRKSNAFVKIYNGELNEGIRGLNEVLFEIEKNEKLDKVDKSIFEFCAENLAKAYQMKGDFKSVADLHQKQLSFLSKFHDNQLNEELQNIEISYQTKEKDFSIQQLEENNAQQNTIIKQQRYLGVGMIGLFLTFLTLGYMLFKQRRLKNRYRLENLEQRLLRSQMNPHFVFNALHTACGLVEKKSDQTIPYINKMATLFRLILENSREELVSFDDEILALKNYLELQSNFSEKFAFNITIEKGIDNKGLIVPPMLIQPFVENAILHGLDGAKTNGRIDLDISKNDKDGLVKCIIRDNGIGYEKTANKEETNFQNHKPVSSDIVNERLSLLRKKFKVNSRYTVEENLPEGTTVILYLPYFFDE